MKQVKLNREEFEKLREKAGFESDSELAESLGLKKERAYYWKNKSYPDYAIKFLKLKILEKNFNKNDYDSFFAKRNEIRTKNEKIESEKSLKAKNKEVLKKEEFKKLREEAGFRSDTELVEFLGFSYQAINKWNTGSNPYPLFLFNFLKLKILEKNFDFELYEALFQNIFKIKNVYKKNIYLKKFETLSLNELEAENIKLKNELIYLKNLIKQMTIKRKDSSL